MDKAFSGSELLLRSVFWAAAYEAEDVADPLVKWLFGTPLPAHESYMTRVESFFTKATGVAPPPFLSSIGAGERLLLLLEALETPGEEPQQYAVLYYAIALGLTYIGDRDDGTGAGVPSRLRTPPRVRMGRERLRGEDDPS